MRVMFGNLVRLMRPKHYVKNVLILVPLVFGSQLLVAGKLAQIAVAIIAFSLITSVVYIINDIRDVKKDRLHPRKKHRPLAAKKVSIAQAVALASGLFVVAVGLGVVAHFSLAAWLLLVAYLIINIVYSFGLKNVPVLDIVLLASGFVIRVLFGASVVGIEVSHWLYMTVLAGAFYISLGKRRNEIMTSGTKSRKVNELYSLQFLDKNMYVCFALTLVFYSLWATDPARMGSLLYLTIPFVMVIFMTYSLAIERNDSSGDPVDVVMKHPILLALIPTYAILTVALVYFR